MSSCLEPAAVGAPLDRVMLDCHNLRASGSDPARSTEHANAKIKPTRVLTHKAEAQSPGFFRFNASSAKDLRSPPVSPPGSLVQKRRQPRRGLARRNLAPKTPKSRLSLFRVMTHFPVPYSEPESHVPVPLGEADSFRTNRSGLGYRKRDMPARVSRPQATLDRVP